MIVSYFCIIFCSGHANYSFNACLKDVKSLVKPVDRQGMHEQYYWYQ